MMIRDNIKKAVVIIQRLNKKEYERFLLIVLVATGLFFIGIIYFSHQKSSFLVAEIKRLHKLAHKSSSIVHKYNKIKQEEGKLQNLLNQYKQFKIKIFFEQFCKEHNIIPSPGWDTTSESVSSQIEEISLPATFKQQTTQKLVSILQDLNKRKIVYVKNLSISKAENKRINFDITIATKKNKETS